jgi:hypothetical protein
MKYLELIEFIYDVSEKAKWSPKALICVLVLLHDWRVQQYPKGIKMPLVRFLSRSRLSRPTIIKAIKEVESFGFIQIDRGGPRTQNIYNICPKLMVKYLTRYGKNIDHKAVKIFTRYGKNIVPYNNKVYTNISKERVNGKNINHNLNGHNVTSRQQPINNPPKKKLSVWHLTEIKKVCEQELNQLRKNGFEDAWGFQWAKEDKPRVKELNKKLKEINKKILDAET